MDHRADAADDKRHHGRERVEAERDRGMELARDYPRPQRHFERRARGHRREPHETPQRNREGEEDHSRTGQIDRAAAGAMRRKTR